MEESIYCKFEDNLVTLTTEEEDEEGYYDVSEIKEIQKSIISFCYYKLPFIYQTKIFSGLSKLYNDFFNLVETEEFNPALKKIQK
jgi:hypothetical protein